jgi:tetratricopeptide (TPR) repeat protein
MPKRGYSALWYAALIPCALLMLQLGSLLSANVGQAFWLSFLVRGQQGQNTPGIAERLFDLALWLDPENASARAGQGYVLLHSHHDAEALESLLASIRANASDPFVYSAALRLLCQRGEIARALELLTTSPPEQMSVELADYVTLLYLQQGHDDAWGKIVLLKPADLYAHYRLWERASASQDQAGAGQHHQALQQFPQSALYPRAPELAELEWSLLPTFYARGLWSPQFMGRVLSDLVWQKPTSTALERALQTLVNDYPLEQQWTLLLGQLYERRGQWDPAETAYRRALQAAPTQGLPRLRLALALNRRVASAYAVDGDLESAYQLLTEYHRLAPQDTECLRALVSLSRRVDPLQTDVLQRKLDALVDPRQLAAAHLSVAAESIEIGPNLLANPGFEVWPEVGELYGWEPLDISRYEFAGPALFIVGGDPCALDGANSARIDALWLVERADKGRPRAGLWALNTALGKVADFVLEPGSRYLASIEYKSEDAGLSLWFANDPRVSPTGEQVFPQTGGQTRMASFVLQATAHTRVSLLIRQVGEGALIVDNVSLRKIMPVGRGGS